MTYFLSEKDGAPVLYYKPVQTGFPEDSDADVVASVCGGRTEFGQHSCELLVKSTSCLICWRQSIKSPGIDRFLVML